MKVKEKTEVLIAGELGIVEKVVKGVAHINVGCEHSQTLTKGDKGNRLKIWGNGRWLNLHQPYLLVK